MFLPPPDVPRLNINRAYKAGIVAVTFLISLIVCPKPHTVNITMMGAPNHTEYIQI